MNKGVFIGAGLLVLGCVLATVGFLEIFPEDSLRSEVHLLLWAILVLVGVAMVIIGSVIVTSETWRSSQLETKTTEKGES